MFRIRRIYDDFLPRNREAIRQAQQILQTQFDDLADDTIAQLPDLLRDPLKHRFRSILIVAEDENGQLKGFALLSHAPDLNFCYLDFISAAEKRTGSGIGSVLYETVREIALSYKAAGLFFECLPDDPRLCRDNNVSKQNAARLRFYERYNAKPIVHTAYETPVTEGDDCPPYLVFDGLGQGKPLSCNSARAIARAILERKYGDVCPKEYIQMVVESFNEDPVQLREYKYIKKLPQVQPTAGTSRLLKIALVVSDKHEMHYVSDRGYVESPVRIPSILREIEATGLFDRLQPSRFSQRYIMAVHATGFVNYLKKVCSMVPSGKSVYPYVFPIRNAARPPKELPVRAGYYCIDTFTPLNQEAYCAAKRAVDCTLTAADTILKGHRIAYALVRPPGHHAERNVFGGFCYFNSGAIAAHYLSAYGKVCILDIDYHHGNGQQNIFYQRNDVLTISIHGHPRFAYPYFSGFADEKGEGRGVGFNINYPLQEHLDGKVYRLVLENALKKVKRFTPQFLIVALGLDTAKGDPTGSWSLTGKDFEMNGSMIGALGYPLLIVQEGGYRVRSLGVNARNFFMGLWKGVEQIF
jgi:acetoin utilization deacetylase AcuC-like enzyme/GNAT superfamily N-acetyltransferase